MLSALLAEEPRALSPAGTAVAEAAVRDAALGGVHLTGGPRDRFNELSRGLSTAANTFQNNVLDATAGFKLRVTETAAVAGLPPGLLASCAVPGAPAAEGPWDFTLDDARYGQFMAHCGDRALREAMYRAHVTRAGGSNARLMSDILRDRHERAALLGHADFASQSLASKMAPSPAAVRAWLEDLRERCYAPAAAELVALGQFAAAHGAPSPLAQWDVPYWARRHLEETVGVDDEALRVYFPLDRVLSGLFGVASDAFGVTIEHAPAAHAWHADVQMFRVSDARSGAPLASFYLDPYARPGTKRGGAWMDACIGRSAARALPGSVRARAARAQVME